ncbi:uncharacterized protein LOC123870493 [Maniola jurtina]|uniref:uncharacterized protein LOC123870493 n=1 Tax=Maniola jurtina TaxID=191418 RepID=UPI001E688948|nr:uncharacterized protein LOC123870493 [Maniola jurtina]
MSLSSKLCRVSVKSLNESFSTDLVCYVLPAITDNVPGREIDISSLRIPSDILLADPHFYKPAGVDLCIGSDVFWDLLGSRSYRQGYDKPVLWESRLGWLVGGRLVNRHNSNNRFNKVCCLSTDVSGMSTSLNDDINAALCRFWQLEEVSCQSSYSAEERVAEEHFVKNMSRLKDVRFCVRIPLKKSRDMLGDSFERAKRSLFAIERKFRGQPLFKQRYIDFMSEYLSLGHMTECDFSQAQSGNFIPHHGVMRETSCTTKLRVVFNASSPTTSGVSLNDLQMVGPTVQDDLLSILLRFRTHKIVLAADVEKMYRQIVVHPEDRNLQLIVWRRSSSEPIKTYQLNTVTYGTASAPFLATRCLKQIGLECNDAEAREIILHDFYVDDLLTGANSLEEVIEIRKKVSEALSLAGMPLRKWKSNDSRVVSSQNEEPPVCLNMGDSEVSKTLGLNWQARSDDLRFSIDSAPSNVLTKRGLLSVIAQIFDPLGLLSPCVITMKMLLQKLWLHKLAWDDQLPLDIAKTWCEILETLPVLNTLRIPRLILCHSYTSVDLHIFSDASEGAYGACLYVRSIDAENNTCVRLLAAKSKVAPLKPKTIPQLELCGALVGVRLYEKVKSSLRVKIRHSTFWTDSTIVLGWLKMLPSRLTTFVRNRVGEILERTQDCSWRHVPTDKNPADHLSRGVKNTSIPSLDLWWSGPSFLRQDMSQWPSQIVTVESLPEVRSEISLLSTVNVKGDTDFIRFDRFSNFLRLQRCMVYVIRFIKACKRQASNDFISEDELQNALNVMIRISQKESFSEYDLLMRKQKLPSKSQLLKLNVFMDDQNIMRVGGRLENSSFAYEKKHPILLQSTHKFTKLLFDFEHKKLMHAGPQLLLASIRENYWPIGGRNLARLCYHQCILCKRMQGKVIAPLMGNLPSSRLLPGGYPFECTGVDYAGPIMCANRQGRGCRLVKVYIAIFVCFTTKALHVELVGDLSSANFLSALRRFISRRGKPKHIYSDNGTSFVGAYKEIGKFLKDSCISVSESVANEGIAFHFIPPYSPHFGGLWEAGVKSVKYHLRRVLGNSNFTYEQLNTVLVQIEGLLNSRPLTPLSSDPNDLQPLTPAHFLIGRPLTALPVPNYENQPVNRLNRYQRIEQVRQHFWTRWSKEYISELQHRSKWQVPTSSLNVGDLVAIKEDGLPPLKWKLGRVVAVYPGSDGIARVADIRTASGVVSRSFSKICPLREESSG